MRNARLAHLAALTHGTALLLAGCVRPSPPPTGAMPSDSATPSDGAAAGDAGTAGKTPEAGGPAAIVTRRLPIPNAPPGRFRDRDAEATKE